nr:odorant receptor 49 [Podabrus annulatus]
MKEFNAKAILYNSKRVMQYIGIWPEINPSGLYNLRGLFAFIIITMGMLLMLKKGVQDLIEGDYENGSYALCLMLIAAHASFKVWFLLTNKSPFFEILTNLENPALLYHNNGFDIYLQDKVQFSKNMFNGLLIVCVNAAITLGISEYAIGYSSNPRVFPIKTDPSHLILYIFVWIFFTIFILYCGVVIGSFEGLVSTFLSLGIAQLKILQQEIMHSSDFYPSDIHLTKEEIRYYDQMANTKLSNCVKRHNAIERYVASIEAKFSLAFLIQYFITLGVTGLLGLNFIFARVTSPDFLMCICFFIADLMQVFLVCYSCNEIYLESEKIRDACYFSNWRACGPSVRKTLYIIMERTKRPFYFTVGKFSVISLDTFLIILKTSMSYFTVLKSLYEGDSNLN